MRIRLDGELIGKEYISVKKGGVKIKPLHHFCNIEKHGKNYMVFYDPRISKFVTDMEKIVGYDTQYTDSTNSVDINLYELCAMIYDNIELEV